MFTIYGGKTEFVQWELGQKVVNPDMCDCEQVVFTMSNGRVGVSSAYEYEGQMVADVPNHLLKYDGKMKVDLGQVDKLRIDERTFFNVVKADEPEGYVCTDNCNLKKKYLETTEQALTDAEKAQVRKNIGAGEPSGGVSSWNDLTDKPVVKQGGDTLTWDGNTEGRVVVGDTFCKVSDAVPTAADCSNGGVMNYDGDTAELAFIDMGEGIICDSYMFMAIIPESAVGLELDGMIFPESGVYMNINTIKSEFALTIPGYTGFDTETLDPEYLPGAVMLYVDAENYLCSDSAATERITKSELKNIASSGLVTRLVVDEDGFIIYFGLINFAFAGSYGLAQYYNGSVLNTLYTAEYTA